MRSPLAALLALMPLTAAAGGLYWSDRPSGAQSIRACNFDGSNLRNVRALAAAADPRGVAVDTAGGRIYYLARTGGVLESVDLAGLGFIQHASGLTQPSDLRLDAANRVLYWCEESAGLLRKAALPALPATPGALTPLSVFTGLVSPYYLDLAGASLYWGTSNAQIFSGPLSGGAATQLYAAGLNVRGVKVDAAAGMLYWAEKDGSHVINRRLVAGGAIQTIYTAQNAPHGIVLDLPAGKIYWVDTGTNGAIGFNARGVTRGDLDGSGGAEKIVLGTASNQPWDIDLDPRVTTFPEWRARFFRLDAAAALTAADADPDGDGRKNLAEYAHGTAPLRVDASSAGAVTRVTVGASDYAAIQFQRRTGASDLIYRVEVSDDLATWRDNSQPGGPYTVEHGATPAEENLEMVTVRSTTPISGSARQFLRVTVEAP